MKELIIWSAILFGLGIIFLIFALSLSNIFYSESKKRFLRRVFNQNNHSILIGGKNGNGKKTLVFFILEEYSKHWNHFATYPKPENREKLINVYSNLDKSFFKGLKLEYHKIDSTNWDSTGKSFKKNSFIIIDDLFNTLKNFREEENIRNVLKAKEAKNISIFDQDKVLLTMDDDNDFNNYKKPINLSYITNNFKRNNQKIIVIEQNWMTIDEKTLSSFNFYAYIWESDLKIKKERIVLNIKGTDFLETYSRKIQKNPKVFKKKKNFSTTENYEINIKRH